MSPAKLRLIEDRAMRDAARSVVTREIDFLKADVREHGLASRVASTGADYAKVVAEGATDLAREHKGKLSIGLLLTATGLAAWIFRDRLQDLVQGMIEGLTSDDEEQDQEDLQEQ